MEATPPSLRFTKLLAAPGPHPADAVDDAGSRTGVTTSVRAHALHTDAGAELVRLVVWTAEARWVAVVVSPVGDVVALAVAASRAGAEGAADATLLAQGRRTGHVETLLADDEQPALVALDRRWNVSAKLMDSGEEPDAGRLRLVRGLLHLKLASASFHVELFLTTGGDLVAQGVGRRERDAWNAAQSVLRRKRHLA